MLSLFNGTSAIGALVLLFLCLILAAYDFTNLIGVAGAWKALRDKLAEVFSPGSGHDHDGVNSKAVSTVVAPGSVTNAMMANDVKIGSLAALTTVLKTSVQAAINELVTSIAAKYTLPGAGIPEASLHADVQAKLAANVNAAQGEAAGQLLAMKTVTLGGANPTQVRFQGADVAATLLGTQDAPFAITPAQTFVVDPDGAGDVTATFTGTQGTSTSGATPSLDMTGDLLDNKLRVAVDGGADELVTCDWTGANSGALIATELQTQIQALGGEFAAVTVDYNVTVAGKYTITSGTYGTGSAVVVTPAASGNCTEELKLGTADGGVEAAGTGDAAATSAAEAAAKLAALAGLTAAAVGNKVRITSDTQGPASSLVVNAGCALDTVFGITGSDYGEAGLGMSQDMADALYKVIATRSDAAGAPGDTVAAGNKATTGFDLYCETAGSVDDYDLLIMGTPA